MGLKVVKSGVDYGFSLHEAEKKRKEKNSKNKEKNEKKTNLSVG